MSCMCVSQGPVKQGAIYMVSSVYGFFKLYCEFYFLLRLLISTSHLYL